MKSMLSKSKNDFVILTCKAYEQGNAALQGLQAYLVNLGFKARLEAWQKLDFARLDEKSVLLPLAVWDYSLDFKAFLSFLKTCEQKKIYMQNELSLIKTNLNKIYLKSLQDNALSLPKSLFLLEDEKLFWQEQIQAFKQNTGLKELIIKPLIGQSGYKVKRLTELKELDKEYENGALVQEFISGISEFGELCLIFFKAEFCYAIKREVPKGEFRANSAYRVIIKPCENVPKEALNLALKAVQSLAKSSLYARVDLFYDGKNFLINELELIEPSLYFDFCENSYKSFVKALLERLN
ncbi:hypothetical protein CQA38_03880 [Campylobacter sp. MIT 12-5580]|nr:hypothetical protein CQA38_03880 [Campylobacter sp. MIT 12-5580]